MILDISFTENAQDIDTELRENQQTIGTYLGEVMTIHYCLNGETFSDKAEMVSAVISALPKYEGRFF